jgi:hypothetical protein
VNEHELAEALLQSRRLTDAQALDRSRIEAELASIISEWIRRWRVY